jgi:hypothetical protein
MGQSDDDYTPTPEQIAAAEKIVVPLDWTPEQLAAMRRRMADKLKEGAEMDRISERLDRYLPKRAETPEPAGEPESPIEPEPLSAETSKPELPVEPKDTPKNRKPRKQGGGRKRKFEEGQLAWLRQRYYVAVKADPLLEKHDAAILHMQKLAKTEFEIEVEHYMVRNQIIRPVLAYFHRGK